MGNIKCLIKLIAVRKRNTQTLENCTITNKRVDKKSVALFEGSDQSSCIIKGDLFILICYDVIIVLIGFLFSFLMNTIRDVNARRNRKNTRTHVLWSRYRLMCKLCLCVRVHTHAKKKDEMYNEMYKEAK